MYDVGFAMAESCYLEPPEDTRRICFQCSVCGEDVREDDEYYEIGELRICESCINDSHRYADCDEDI